jgi:hypothetical protein
MAETPLARLFAASGRSLREVARALEMDPRSLQLIIRGETDARLSTVGRVLDQLGGKWADLDPPQPGRARRGSSPPRTRPARGS